MITQIDHTDEYIERLKRTAVAPSRLARAKITLNLFAGKELFLDTTDQQVHVAIGKLKSWSDRTVRGSSASYPWPWLVNIFR